MHADEVSGRLFRQLLIPKEEEEFNCFWALLERLVDETPFYLLECNREPEAARLAYETMRRKEHAED